MCFLTPPLGFMSEGAYDRHLSGEGFSDPLPLFFITLSVSCSLYLSFSLLSLPAHAMVTTVRDSEGKVWVLGFEHRLSDFI